VRFFENDHATVPTNFGGAAHGCPRRLRGSQLAAGRRHPSSTGWVQYRLGPVPFRSSVVSVLPYRRPAYRSRPGTALCGGPSPTDRVGIGGDGCLWTPGRPALPTLTVGGRGCAAECGTRWRAPEQAHAGLRPIPVLRRILPVAGDPWRTVCRSGTRSHDGRTYVSVAGAEIPVHCIWQFSSGSINARCTLFSEHVTSAEGASGLR
jgi:hypothetical protein